MVGCIVWKRARCWCWTCQFEERSRIIDHVRVLYLDALITLYTKFSALTYIRLASPFTPNARLALCRDLKALRRGRVPSMLTAPKSRTTVRVRERVVGTRLVRVLPRAPLVEDPFVGSLDAYMGYGSRSSKLEIRTRVDPDMEHVERWAGWDTNPGGAGGLPSRLVRESFGGSCEWISRAKYIFCAAERTNCICVI